MVISFLQPTTTLSFINNPSCSLSANVTPQLLSDVQALLLINLSFGKTQPEKAEFPILVTLLGMVTEVKEEQEEKALLPILVTLLGMVTEVKKVQLLKA